MTALLDLLGGPVAGVATNALWDAIKAGWEHVTRKSLDELYLDAFEAAVHELRPYLQRYARDGEVELPSDALIGVLRRDLGVSVGFEPLSTLSTDEWVARLAAAMQARDALTIGGHNLSAEDYAQLLRSLIRHATARYREAIVADAAAFRRAVLAEVQTNAALLRETEAYLHHQLGRLFEAVAATSSRVEAHAQREEVLHEISREHASAEARETRAAVAALTARLDALSQQFSSVRISDRIGREHRARERAVNERVDVARDLLRRGQPRSARPILEGVQREIAQQAASPQLRFRVATNLGACAAQLGELQAAAAHFREALAQQPESPLALANAAWAALFRHDAEAALRLAASAREKGPRDAAAAAVYLLALHRSGRAAEIAEFLAREPWVAETPACLRILGQLQHEAGDYPEAEQFLRRAALAEPTDAEAPARLAVAIMAQVEAELLADPPLPWVVPPPAAVRLALAEDALTRALHILESHEVADARHGVLVNRAAARAIRRDFDGALADCDRVLVEDATNMVALRNKGLLLVRSRRPAEAIPVLERVTDPEQRSAVLIPLALAYYQAGQAHKAVDVLTPLWQAGPAGYRLIEIAELLRASYEELGRREDADRVVETLARARPTDPDALATVAEHRFQRGNADEAVRLLTEAERRSAGHQTHRIVLESANFHYQQGDWRRASQLYARVVDATQDNPFTRSYVVSLINVGAYRAALTIVRDLRRGGPPLPWASEIEAKLLEHLDELPEAILLRRQLALAEPANAAHPIRTAIMEYRRGNAAAARAALAGARAQQIADPHLLMLLAETRSLLGDADVMEPAYRARRLGFNHPEIHVAYASLVLRREQTGNLAAPAEVGVDCAVHLLVDGAPQTYVIIGEGPAALDRGELLPGDALARQLLGRSAGETFTLGGGPGGGRECQITSVQNKYVYSFQQTARGFATWFPDRQDLYHFQLRDDDLSPIFEALDRRHEWVTRVLGLYRERKLTVAVAARLLGRSVVATWAGLAGLPDDRFYVATGDVSDLQKEVAALESAEAVVLDTTALLTLAWLELEDRLPDRPGRIIVPQPVLDAITDALTLDHHGPAPAMAIARVGDEYVRQEVSPDQVERNRAFLERIRDFVTTRAEVVGLAGVLALAGDDFEQQTRVLGESALSAALVAAGKNALLFADDLVLRDVARQTWGVESVWTQSVLLDLLRRSAISDEEWLEAIRRLALANYYSVSVNAHVLLWTIQGSSDNDAEIERVFRLLRGPDCTEDSAIRVLADTLAGLTSEWLPDDKRDRILELALNALVTGREEPARLSSLFARALAERLPHLPLERRRLLLRIHEWERRHGLSQ